MSGRFDHVGLTVADLGAMTAWYVDAFGLEVEFEFALDQVDFRGAMLTSPEGWATATDTPGRFCSARLARTISRA